MRIDHEETLRIASEKGTTLTTALERAGVSRTAYYSLRRRDSILPRTIRALAGELGVEPEVICGTMSKSLGSGGGFASGSEEFCSLLLNKARSFIFSTGLAPGCLGSAIEALKIINENPGMVF